MKKLAILILPVLLFSCQPEPRPIEYGADACDYCRMTIVDRQHAAEVVTQKGRVYKFDAIECMSSYIQREGEDQFALLLVNDFLAPGELIDARTATYLISPAIPSPMGAFLTAFREVETARQMQSEKGGDLFDWTDLQRHLQSEGMVFNLE